MTRLITVAAIAALAGRSEANPRWLAPTQDVKLWPGQDSCKSPLQSVGANGPYTTGPNVFGISPDPPEQCVVDQAAFVIRHGSRYPDHGAYGGWKELEAKLSNGGYEASGALSFLPKWHPVLTNPDIQIAQESPTGVKEAMDLGYELRTKYSNLYNEGDDFYVWANNYTRVIQTASSFVHGFLGANATLLGNIVAVTAKNIPEAIGNSLAPSDACPNFHDLEGGTEATTWNAIWQPPVLERLQGLITGNLSLTTGDINSFPYLCGFESQITGRMSPFCDVYTELELRDYEYSNDLRYYYGVGPGTEIPPKMMTPYLDALVDMMRTGPGQQGKLADGSAFAVPNLLMSFLNDGQLIEILDATGVFDEQETLSPTSRDESRLWNGSRFVTMRGTAIFERLNCDGETFMRIKLNDQVYPIPSCKDGPGSSCPLDKYSKMIKDKMEVQGDWMEVCNVTVPDAPTKAVGASFYTDLAQPHLKMVTP